jgi:hypothetical protein
VFYVEALNPGLDLLGEQLAAAGIRNLSSVVTPSLSQRPDLFEGAWISCSGRGTSTTGISRVGCD